MAVALATVGIQVFHAQNSRPLDIQGLFTLIDTNNSSVRVSKTSIEAARHDVEAAKSQRLPDINAQLSASFIGNALLTDRDFSEVHGLHSPHFGNQFIVDASQTIYSGGALTAGIKMSELGLEKAGIAYENIYANENEDMAKAYDIVTAPTLVVPDGDGVKRLKGVSEIRKYIESL